MKTTNPILLVEDDKVDAMTVKRAIKEIKITNELIIRENGEEALAYLTDTDNIMPCIILLDLNMPRMNGFEFMKLVKGDSRLKLIPIIILTTSKEEQDRLKSFENSVAGYMIKPVDYLQFVEAMKTIDLYWSISELAIS